MIGMPKSMMQEEMSPLGPVVKKADAFMLTKPVSQEEFRAQFERGDHLPDGSVVPGTFYAGGSRQPRDANLKFTTFDWLDGTREVRRTKFEFDDHGTVKIEADPGLPKAQHDHLLAYAQEQADTIVALRAEVRKLQEGEGTLPIQVVSDEQYQSLGAYVMKLAAANAKREGLTVEGAIATILRNADMRKRADERPKPDGEGWIAWAGGECPVGPGVKVEVKHRNGQTDLIQSGRPFLAAEVGESWWRHGLFEHPEHCEDIVAYRVVG